MRLAPGSTIYSGDTIHVDARGAARISLPDGAQIQVGENSLVEVARREFATQVIVDYGGVAFRSTEKSRIEAVLGDATIRSADGSTVVGMVKLRGADTAVVVAERGRLAIATAHDASLTILQEGEGREVRLVADSTEALQGGAAPAGSSRGRRVVILAAILAGVVTAIALTLANQEPDTTNCNAVSPFRCP